MTRLSLGLARKFNRSAVLASFVAYLTLSSVLPGLPLSVPVASATAPTCTTTLNPGDNIQSAISSASPGSVICLNPGLYQPVAPITVSKGVTITRTGCDANVITTRTPGNASTEAIIDGGGSLSKLFKVTANNATLSCLEMRHTKTNVITTESSPSSLTIQNNIIHNSHDDGAIYLDHASNATVKYNDLYDMKGYSIAIDHSTNTHVSDNRIHDMQISHGSVYAFFGSTNTTVDGNLFYNFTGDDVVKLGTGGNPSDNVGHAGSVTNNVIVNGPQDAISIYQSGATVTGNKITGMDSDNGAIYVTYNIGGVTIDNNLIVNNDTYGIRVGKSTLYPSNVTVNNNCIEGNSNGLLFNYHSGPALNAQHNWWGAASGPSGSGPGTGDSVSSHVDFSSFNTTGCSLPAIVDSNHDGIPDGSDDPLTVPVPACDPSNSFDTFNDGSVNSQGGWNATGPYDQAIVDNTYGYSSFGCKSLRISNAVTSGAFGDQTFAPPAAGTAGESAVASNNHYETQFDIATTQPTVQPGLTLSVSPDDGHGSRMSYLRFEDHSDGIHVFFDDVTDNGPLGTVANFNESDIATLSRTAPHTIKFSIDFVDGPGNDVVKIYIDGSLVHTGTTWENYYRYDPEQSGNGNQLSPIDTLIFRAGGTAVPGTSGKGFLFDNFSLSSSNTVGQLDITKYACFDGTSVDRATNGPDANGNFTVPAGCWPEPNVQFGYTYQADKTDNSAPYVGADGSTPFTSVGTTNGSGQIVVTGLSSTGRYNVAELNGDGSYNYNKSGLISLFCYGDPGGGTDNYDVTYVPAGGTAHCVAYDSAGPQCVPTNANLVGYWKLDEMTAGSTVVDSAGSNNGTPHNNPAPGSSVPSGLSFGDPRSLNFDGTQYVDLGNSLSNTTNFTVSAWVNPSSLGSDRQIISKGYDGTNTQWELKTTSNDGKVSFRAWNGTAVGVESLTPLVAGQWTHVVGTYDGTTWKIYLNGVLNNSAVAGAPVATTRDLVIGGVDANGTVIQKWVGNIDDVRIYNTSLSASQIAELDGGACSVTSTSSSSSSSSSSVVACTDSSATLVARWNFDEGTGTTVNDSAGVNDAGTIAGATWTGTVPTLAYGNAAALSFNGVTDHVTVGNATSLQFDTTDSFSASAWVNPTSFSGYQTVIHKIDDTNSARRGYLFTLNNGVPEVWILSDYGAGNYLRVAASTTLATGSWQQIGFSYDGSGLASGVKIYVNGADVTGGAIVNTLSGTIANAKNFEIGYRTDAAAQPYAGLMDEVRVYNTVVNASQMAELGGGQCSVSAAEESSSETSSAAPAVVIDGYRNQSNGTYDNSQPIRSCGTTTGSGFIAFEWHDANPSDPSVSYEYKIIAGPTAVGYTQIHTDTHHNGGIPQAGTYTVQITPKDAANNVGTPVSCTMTYDPHSTETSSAASSAQSSSAVSVGSCTTTGIAGYWKLDEGSGTFTADSTGLGHNGTLQNGPLWTTGTPLITPNPAAVSFDGSDDFISVANSSDYNYGTQEFTVSAFVKTTNGNTSVLGNFNGSSPYRGWGLYIYNNNAVNFFGYGDQGANDAAQSAGTVLDGNWHNLVGVYHRSGNTLTIDTYIDGVLAGSHSATVGDISANNTLLFGHYLAQPNFNGNLDDIRVYSRALTAGEIASINAGCTNTVASSSSSVSSSSSSHHEDEETNDDEGSSSSTPHFFGFTSPQHDDTSNGGYHGHQTDTIGGALHFLSNFFLGGHTAPGGFGGIAPGGFGGSTTFTGAEHDLICSTKKALPLNASNAILEWAAGILSQEMQKNSAAILSALKDANFCPVPHTPRVSNNLPIPFHVSAAGYPVSSNATWNACITGKVTLQDIRNNPDKDSHGRGLDCAAYHTDDLWRQPDLNMFFTWNPTTKTVTLPNGYVVVTDAPVLQ